MDSNIEKLLLKPQIPHVNRLINSINNKQFAADFSSTGTGKTYTSCAVAKSLNVPVVIICPKVSISTWKRVCELFDLKPELIINYELLIRGNTKYYKFNKKQYVNKKNWYDSDGIIIKFPSDCLVILDECHKCKGYKSKNGEMLTALKNNKYKLLMLSATMASHVTELRHIGYSLNLHTGHNFVRFAKDHGAVNDGFGGLINGQDSNDGMVRIHDALFNLEKTVSKMNIEDFGDVFPDNHIIADCFDMGNNTAKIQMVYDLMEKELIELEESCINYKEHQFAIMTKYRRSAELLKIPSILEKIEDLFDEGISPVIFLNYTDSVEAIKNKLINNKKFEGLIGYIIGGQLEKVRNDDIDAFQSDKKRIMIVNLAAGGVGINLHDLNGNFPRHTIISPTWSAINLIQSLGRCHRANGKTSVIQSIFFAADTIEEKICQRVKIKLENIHMLNDGDLDFNDNLQFI